MKHQKGSALLLTLFLVAGIMIVAFAGSYIIISGLRSGGLQYDSSRAYFVAESGAEYSLWQVRRNNFDLRSNLYGHIFSNIAMPGTYQAKFTVDYKTWAPIVLTSIGSYGVTQRSVELSF